MFLDIPREKFMTESYGEICQANYYYALKMKEVSFYTLKSKAKVYEIPFTFKMEIDVEKLKELPKNEQQFYLDVCSGAFIPKFKKTSEKEKKIWDLVSDDIYEMHF